MSTLFDKIFSPFLNGKVNKSGSDLIISCPFHADNTPSFSVSTDENKPVVYCFSCGFTGTWVDFYMATRGVNFSQAKKDLDLPDKEFGERQIKMPPLVKPREQVIVDYSEDCINATKIFYNGCHQYFADKLYKARGITLETAVCCLIGFLKNVGWIFPVVRFSDGKFVGYEIREKNFGKFHFGGREMKCYKAPHTPSCLSVVFQPFKPERVVITEGFIDGYKMYQYIVEKHGECRDLILTPSNGVGTIPELMKKAKLPVSDDKVLFVLDNDEAGNKVVTKLQDMNKNYKFFGGLQDGEDFDEYYERKKKSARADTEKR